MAVFWSGGPSRRHTPNLPVPTRNRPATAQKPLQARLEAVPLTTQDRRTIAAALDLAIVIGSANGAKVTRHRLLMERMLEDDPGYGIPTCDLSLEEERDLSRPQELAADRLAAEYGRTHVRWQADGSVVITGLTDDIERATICVERDGRERWRS